MRPVPLVSDALLHCGAGGLAVAGAAVLSWRAGFGPATAATALAVYLGICLFVLTAVPRHAPHARFGIANAVTLLRAALIAVLAGFAAESAAFDAAARGALALAALAALLLDGVDGWHARRQGLASAFGACFDLEIDALTVLVLALLVYGTGQADAWVIVLGAMRYLSLLVGRVFPVLSGELEPSWRRKAICVATIAALIAALAPPVSPGTASALCLAVAILLIYSFGADGILLVRGARAGIEAGAAPS